MKKTLLSLTVATALILSSCGGGGGYEADARKVANLVCDVQKLSVKAMAGDEDAKKKMDEKSKELEALSKELEKKYEGKENKDQEEKAKKIAEEIMEKCK